MTWLRIAVAIYLTMFAFPAAAAWQKAVSDNFIVYGDTSEKQLRRFVGDLEKFAAMLRLRSGAAFDPDAPKLTVFAVEDVTAVQRAHGTQSNSVAGFYMSNLWGSMAVVPRRSGDGGSYDLDAQVVLFHEYAHHFMLQHFGGANPGWYVEGFAEFYSTTRFNEDGSVDLGRPALHRAYALSGNEVFPIKRLLGIEVRGGRMTAVEVDKFYGSAWLLTHYLSFEPSRRGQLTSYLKAFASGVSAETAAQQAFGDLAVLERELLRYRRAVSTSIMTVKSRGMVLPEAAMTVTPLNDVESAAMPLYIRYLRGSNGKEQVASFAADARKLAARYPGHPATAELLAEGELDAGELEAATRANEQLLALRPEEPRALLRRARIAVAQMDKGEYAGGWPAVRRLIVRANRAAPNDPYPLFTYFDSFRREGASVPDLAIEGVLRAQQLVPQERQLRSIAAQHMLRRGKRDEAQYLLAPMLNDPHNAEAREWARALLDGTPAPGKDIQAEDKDAAGAQ